jgi:hypothetical protein
MHRDWFGYSVDHILRALHGELVWNSTMAAGLNRI